MEGIKETRSGEGIIFLDLESDDYLCRYDPHANTAEEGASGRTTGAASGASGRCEENHWRSDTAPVPAVRFIDVVQFALALGHSAIRFRGRKVADLILIGQSLPVKRRGHHTAPQVAGVFKNLLPLLPVRPQCLFEAFFLLHFLARYGHRKCWIFGAHLFPFRAHCWIADGNILLNEVPHRIEDYQVILAAEPVAS